MVLIMACGLVQDRILSTRGKRWMEHVANMGKICVQVLVSKPQGKRLLVRSWRRWEDNNKMVLQAVVWGRGLKLSALGQEQVLCAGDCDRGNAGSIKRREFLD